MNNEVEKEIIKELSEKYNRKEKVIEIMLERSEEIGYNSNSSKEYIIEFLKQNI